MFLDGERGEWLGGFQYIAYANVTLQSEGDKFSATLSQCSIETGFYVQSYMSVGDPIRKKRENEEEGAVENLTEKLLLLNLSLMEWYKKLKIINLLARPYVI
ncbi:unnamed protein product [Cuscuta epithymum]|uniref:Uncharacterized protein n=1 Tax=Cuscuta epithymum TaxID=186058 RepID=A0AAV0G7T3_9ASTE|nr:unnamed protein product [Cuscuta epithymum]